MVVEEGDKSATEQDAKYNEIMLVHNMTEIKPSVGERIITRRQGLEKDASAGDLMLKQLHQR